MIVIGSVNPSRKTVIKGGKVVAELALLSLSAKHAGIEDNIVTIGTSCGVAVSRGSRPGQIFGDPWRPGVILDFAIIIVGD